MTEFVVATADIMSRPCDLLILKHADGFHGLDRLVANRIGFTDYLKEGEHAWAPGRNIEAREVLFLGVGPLGYFRYERIRAFASRALITAIEEGREIRRVCSPIHGPGYGLDVKESFLSLIAGFIDALSRSAEPAGFDRIEIVEIDEHRANRLSRLLAPVASGMRRDEETLRDWGEHPERSNWPSMSQKSTVRQELRSFGAPSEGKPRLFVAMPYADEYSDVWDIAIQDACVAVGIVCEKMNEQTFVGDIVTEMKARIARASGMIALLDGANANVFLEIGFAWASNKPTILLADTASELPFDVRGQRCLKYRSIANLRTQLVAELKALVEQGVLKPA